MQDNDGIEVRSDADILDLLIEARSERRVLVVGHDEPAFLPRKRRVGITTGLAMAACALAMHTPRFINWGSDETWDDYRLRIRREQVSKETRIPPKKARCSGRHKGRRFKG